MRATVKVLQQVFDALAVPGVWLQGAERNDKGGRSLVGAICDAAGSRRAARPVMNVLAEDLCMRTDLVTWNDAPGRTQAEVLSLLARGIEWERCA